MVSNHFSHNGDDMLKSKHDNKESDLSHERIRLAALNSKVMSAEKAAELFQEGMTVGMSGFTRAGDSKAMPVALAARASKTPFSINLLTGASLGNDSDALMASAGLLLVVHLSKSIPCYGKDQCG